MEERLLLLDGHSLAYRAFFGLPAENFITTSGQITNAVYGFTSMLLTTLEQFQPTHIGVAFDVNRNTFRRERFPEYKANRAATPAEFKGQTELITEVLDVLGIRHAAVEGFEADDVIATWATAAAAAGAKIEILTGDRDSLQLVTDRISVLYPRKGVSDLVLMTPDAVFEKYGVRPDQYADVAAMRGDASDNLPGIPGVGEKTAAAWLAKYGNLDALVKHADELKGKVGDAFRAHASQALLNRQLTELVRDVPGIPGWHDLHQHPGNERRLHELFDVLQFRALRPRALRLIARGEIAQPSVVDESLDVKRLSPNDAIAEVAKSVHIAVSLPVADSDELVIGIMPIGGTPAVSPFTPEVRTALAAHAGLVGHHVKPWLRRYPEIHGWVADTAVMAYLANPGLRATDLRECAQRLLGLELATAEQTSLFDEELPADAGSEAAATAALYAHLGEVLERDGARSLLFDLEMPLMRLLATMEDRGIAVDAETLRALDLEFASRIRTIEDAAYATAGDSFNLGSPKQLQEVLFVKRGLPKTKKTKTGYTTDADALQALFASTADPLLEQILEWREVSKLRQTVQGLLPQIESDGRIRTTFQQTVAATGRLASTDPNLQNIPVRTADGRRIRTAFVPGDGFDVLMTADYSQIEMRIMAHLSNDQGLIDAFRSGEDLHTTVASQVFGVAAADVDSDMRRRIKAMSYGLAYGLSSYGLAQQLSIDPAEAQRLMNAYFDRFGNVRAYLQDVVAKARTTGYTETMLGRRRYLPDLNSDQRVRRELAERMALNAPIQGSAADIIKLAMLRVERALEAKGCASRLLLQVHDELVLECPQAEVHEIAELVQVEMGAAISLSVPLDVSVGVGANWDAAAH